MPVLTTISVIIAVQPNPIVAVNLYEQLASLNTDYPKMVKELVLQVQYEAGLNKLAGVRQYNNIGLFILRTDAINGVQNQFKLAATHNSIDLSSIWVQGRSFPDNTNLMVFARCE